ncbi:hypothetical protein F5Y11DRAFT_27265 [Daldinia sp. FL1419]|nr:hypothetical protein F5Y11DRAFT_27265 [Daldinia sp. FL1419]
MAKRYNIPSVYDTTPYHAYCVSDNGEEDDDVCVWDGPPKLVDMYDSEDERIVAEIHSGIPEENWLYRSEARKDKTPTPIRPSGINRRDSEITVKNISNDPEKTQEEIQLRQVADGLLATRRNLTRMSQFILKLECRAGKVTKEGIKQTLDATVADNSDVANLYPTYLDELEEIKHLSESTWQRLYLIDRHWQRVSRQNHAAKNSGPPIKLDSEPVVKAFLREEKSTNHLTSRDPCYYTAGNLANGRRFEDWIAFLQDFCKFKDDPTEETKLVHLAWRFLDREIRGPRPSDPARIQDFIAELNGKYESGALDKAINNPQKRQEDDDQAWATIKKCWFSGIQH